MELLRRHKFWNFKTLKLKSNSAVVVHSSVLLSTTSDVMPRWPTSPAVPDCTFRCLLVFECAWVALGRAFGSLVDVRRVWIGLQCPFSQRSQRWSTFALDVSIQWIAIRPPWLSTEDWHKRDEWCNHLPFQRRWRNRLEQARVWCRARADKSSQHTYTCIVYGCRISLGKLA